MKKVAVLLADGFEEIEALTVVDILRRASVYVDTVSITDEYKVRGSHGINVQTEDLFDEVNFVEFDMIVLPGGMPGTINLGKSETVTKAAVYCAENGKITAAICAAPSVLGNLGILKGKKATCFPGFEKELEGATYTAAPVEIDGNVITGKGAGCAILFGKAIVEKAVSAEAANKVCGDMQCP